MALQQTVDHRSGAARVTTITTARGAVSTPCFMPVGTRATVRAVESADMDELGAQIVLGNTYHLMLRPGADLIERFGGLHGFAGWDGHVLTDSGGYQIFSLAPKVDDDGATFRSTYDGSTHRLTPEGAVDVQIKLGSDIQMVLDQCPPLPSPPEVVRGAMERTLAWAERARRTFHDTEHADARNQFGIVQGGIDPSLRAESASATVAIGFDGYGIGGLSVGESRDDMLPALDAALAELPDDRPRYLMGVGDPVGIVESIARGVDMFDCVLPTRLARHGTLLTGEGRLNIKNARFAEDDQPLDPTCGCRICARYSRGYIRHLVQVNEPTAARLCTIHNLTWLFALVDRCRVAIEAGTLDALRAEVAATHR